MLLSSTYRVERRWPSSGRWAYVPEHAELTLQRARAIVREGKQYEREGMRQRITRTAEHVIATSSSRRARTLQGLRNLRDW